MVIQIDKRSLTAQSAFDNVTVPVARDGKTASADMTTDSIVQAEFGNQTQKASTGTYAEEVARQLDVKEVNSDLDVMDPANFISQCMTGEDAHDLSEEKTPLEEYTDSSLERALVRVKELRQEKNESVEIQAEKLRETEKQIREKSEEIALDQRMIEQLSRALSSSEIVINDSNIFDVAKAINLVDGVNAFGDAAMKYMVAGESSVTPKSIQDSLYGSGTAMIGKEKSDDAVADIAVPIEKNDGFEEVRPQIEKMLAGNRESLQKDAFDTARWLYQNELPVTEENLSKIDTVKELREMDDQTLLSRIVSEMEDGVLAQNADLSVMSREEVTDLVERLVNTDERTLRATYPAKESLETARRRLEEIRLTMTISSAREMTKLGVSIDIANLEEMVDALRSVEAKKNESLLGEALIDPTSSSAETLKDTIGAASQVLASPVELLSYTFERRQTITLTEMAAEGRTLAAGYASASGNPVQSEVIRSLTNTYEAVGTQVRSDLGDSIRKAFGNMGEMLDEMGLPATPENERAVRILGYNRMEITVESVYEMREYDNRVNELMSAMKPQVVKKMIDDQINPLELSIGELEEQVEKISEEVGTEDVSFSRFLWKLDRQKEISAEERESMIGVYRLLDKIEKSDGAVIGQLVNEGRELSLKNMLDATRTRRKGGIDARVDDENGAAAAKASQTKSIDAQIMSAFIASEVPAMKKVLSPTLMAGLRNMQDMTFEEFADRCISGEGADDETAAYFEEVAEDIRRIVSEKDADVVAFLREMDMPETIGNLICATDLIRRQMKDVKDLWSEDESDEVIEHFDEDDLDDVYEEIEKTHGKALENRKDSDDISFDGMKDIMTMNRHISFFRSMRRYQTYEVPVQTDRGILDCVVTVRSGNVEGKGTVEITADSDELGRVMATFKLSGKKVNGFITAENKDSIRTYEELFGDFEKDLEESGFTMDGNSLIAGNRNSLHAGESAEGAKNQDLYKIAKIFLKSLK